jgi:hypothetical protein
MRFAGGQTNLHNGSWSCITARAVLLNEQLNFHMRLFRLVQFIFLFAAFGVFYDHAVAEETNSLNLSCVSVDSIVRLDSVLSSSSEKAEKTLVYFRADWAIAGTYKNDTYVGFQRLSTRKISSSLRNGLVQLQRKGNQSNGWYFIQPDARH